MWSTIEQIIKPVSLSEAALLLNSDGSRLFAGGTYLLGQQDMSISTLVDINSLMNDRIENHGEEIHIDAGCSLQQLIHHQDERLTSAVLSACPSKNIRNQRTIGGEIAQGRTDSDILIYLYAAKAMLLLSDSLSPVEISMWDGHGIIIKVIIPEQRVKLERVALLDSAPAFIIVGLNEGKDLISVCVGGKTSRILFHETEPQPDEVDIRKFVEDVESIFSHDHLGTVDYKRQLVCSLLQEMLVQK